MDYDLREKFERLYELKKAVDDLTPEQKIGLSPIYIEYLDLRGELGNLLLTGEEIIEAGLGDFTKGTKETKRLEGILESVRRELRGKGGEYVAKLKGLLDS